MRIKELWNEDWYFSKDSTLPTSITDNYEKVSLPHTWNALDGQDGGNDYHRGTCHYIKTFHKSDLPDTDLIYIEFEGVSNQGDVYLNGKHLKNHLGGFSTWRINITDDLQDENTLVVAVDNSKNDIVYPQNADFTFYGGIYRDVHIIGVNKTHFSLDYYGAPGIIITPTLNNDIASVEIEVFTENLEEDDVLLFEIFDKDNNPIDKSISKENKVTFTLENPHLWNGRKDPYLYRASVEIKRDDATIDTVSSTFGIRSFEIDSNRGFILNGEEYPLRGVSRHQDYKGLGNALHKEHHKRDMELIAEMGATTIRLAHYQHNAYFYDLCDAYGMVVWAEIPYISTHMPSGNDNTKTQMTELIVQNYNHPCIVVWGLSNEITLGGMSDDLLKNHMELNNHVHELDKTRKTTLAALSMLETDSPLLDIPDVVSYNHYFGWYGGETDMNGPWFDEFHKLHPNLPVGISEYGCEALNWHTSNPTQGDYTEEYQAYYHEELIKQIIARPYLWATHVWNMFDFGADGRNEGGENGQNHKGLITFDREYKKDSFYAYKAWLSDEKFVHLCGKRYIDRVEDETKVTVYSNLDEVTIYLNDKEFETKKSDLPFFYFMIPNVGETKIRVKAGEYEDEGMIRKVDTFNEAYQLKEVGAILNWFDISEVEGYYSLNDTVGDIFESEEGKKIFGELSKKLFASFDGGSGMEINIDQTKMMEGYTCVRLINLMGGTLDVKISKEELLEINKKLNQIKKVNKS